METKYRPSCRLSLSNYHGYEIWRQLGIHDLAVDATTLRFFLVYPPLCDKNSLFLGGACDLYSCVWIIANGVNLVHWQTRRHYIQFRGTSNLLFLLNHRLHHLCDWQAVKSGVMLSGSPSRSWCLPLVLSIESTSRLQRFLQRTASPNDIGLFVFMELWHYPHIQGPSERRQMDTAYVGLTAIGCQDKGGVAMDVFD
ncbi:predicted protein [Lichtheimia corymbifera JMRC:FSU:9682]|uniref:Uncharacterized protein n=1 Tax=Lichtheimia corymbifera JMRC:FSU:9682 TaxID=1263082 RepID=A0A068RPR7_9FUNG|nr:predicted protein [Lichtheimia corymbifera JMRC:FSU:9682]